MAFKLLIECTKDISNLHIDFTDGTSSVIHNEPKPPKNIKEKEPKIEKTTQNNQSTQHSQKEEFLDCNYGNPIVSERLELPKINLGERGVKVADELQNLKI